MNTAPHILPSEATKNALKAGTTSENVYNAKNIEELEKEKTENIKKTKDD